MKNKKNTLINVFSALVFLFVQMFISFWMSPFVVGKLGEEAYGFINLANNFVSYASLVSVAINSMACRYISVEYNLGKFEESKSYFCSVFIANCFLYSFILLVSIIFISKIELIINISPEILSQVRLTFLLSFINMGTSLIGTVYTAAAFTTNKMHYNSLIQIVSNIVKTAVVFVLFSFLPAKVYYLSIATLIAGVITLHGNYLITKKLFSDFEIKFKYFNFSKLIVLVKSGLWVLVSNISNLLLNGLDLLFSNWFISGSIMGRLSLAKQIPFALSSALGVFSNIFSSGLTKSFVVEGKTGIIEEANNQLRILTFLFTVPYAGIIVYGKDFLYLWLKSTTYSHQQIDQVYLLMILILLDIIVSTYMYSIHSIFIALDKVKVYSIVLFVASFISMCCTLFLLNFSSLGVYAIAGTSTFVLGFTHGIIVPGIASILLDKPIWFFWKTELHSWYLLFFLITIYFLLSFLLNFKSWIMFCTSTILAGILGYVISFLYILNNPEKRKIISMIKAKF